MKWYEDPDGRFALNAWGLDEVPEEPGRWTTENGLREIADFDGGITIITRVLPEHPEFDIQTVHLSGIRDLSFLNDCLRDHLEEMKRRTEDIKARGKEAVAGRGTKS